MTDSVCSNNSLLICIDKQHVENIYAGIKTFELRKQLAHEHFSKVYLYQTKGEGVVGWFDVKAVYRLPIDKLWEKVGTAAATKKRFYKYFDNFKNGNAIGITNPQRFSKNIPSKALRKIDPQFRPPPSSMLMEKNSILNKYLETVAWYEKVDSALTTRIRPILDNDRNIYRELSLKEISSSYDEIDDSFVDDILKSHDEGRDPVGFFTESKEVLRFENAQKDLIGFTTITYKKGGSAKTGPTILLERYQGKGLGQDLRTLIESLILKKGFRKVYCTAPSSKVQVLRYLLKSDYRIEAHLSQQYTKGNDEIVFGKLLLSNVHRYKKKESYKSSKPGKIRLEGSDYYNDGRLQEFINLLSNTWFPFDMSSARRIAKEVLVNHNVIRKKPKSAILMISSNKIIGTVILLPKRGGSVKALIILTTSHSPSIKNLVLATFEKVNELGGRRIYFLHPLADSVVTNILREFGCKSEGILQEPYLPKQDLVVLAHNLNQR